MTHVTVRTLATAIVNVTSDNDMFGVLRARLHELLTIEPAVEAICEATTTMMLFANSTGQLQILVERRRGCLGAGGPACHKSVEFDSRRV